MARKQPSRSASPAGEADEKPALAIAAKTDPKADANKDVIELAMKRWRRADEADRENRDHAYQDLEFLEPGGQWEESAKQMRGEGRPCLEFDRLGTTVAQVTGDIRQMRPSIKVVPVDSRGDPETAEVIAGMVRYVENRSDASAIYFAAADQQVAAGIGHWKVVTEYAGDSTFEQEIAVVPIPDGIGVRWDPAAVKQTREDAKFCFVPLDMPRDDYDEAYPNKPAGEIDDGQDRGPPGWLTADTVRVCEYYTKTPIDKTLALMPDGEILDLTDKGDEDYAERLTRVELAKASGAKVRIEKRPGHRVERYLISATDVLEGPDLIPGRFIPVVPVIGVEQVIGKKRTRRGLVRKAKDGQRAYNYSRSTQIETESLQPKAGFVGTEKQFKGYEHIWETANTVNHPFLPYNTDPQAGTPRPERAQPPVPNAASALCAREAAEDIKATTGVYDASLGAPSNETSGKAIKARQQEGDVGSFVYIDNFGRSVRHTGAIITSMVPHVYDTARTLRIVGEDGKVDLVDINNPQGLAEDGVAEKIENDVTVGAYDVSFEMGPSYTTKREAAFDGMIAFVQAAPQAAPLIMDLLAKMQDWPMADKVAKRIRTMLPPQIQAEEAQEEGKPPPPPPPPSPEQQAAMAAQQRQQELAEAQHQLDGAKLQVEQQKLQAEMAKIQGELQKAALDHQARMAEAARPAEGMTQGGTAEDPRVDSIADALQHLSQIVAAILEELPPAASNGPPGAENGPPAPEEPPMGAMPMDLSQPPPGGFSFDPSALGQPSGEMMGQPA
jgi:hypothetical protein